MGYVVSSWFMVLGMERVVSLTREVPMHEKFKVVVNAGSSHAQPLPLTREVPMQGKSSLTREVPMQEDIPSLTREVPMQDEVYFTAVVL